MQLAMTETEQQRQIMVVGLGLTGLSVLRFLRSQKREVKVMDSRPNPPGLQTLHEEYPQLELCLGKLDPEQLCEASQVVLSPGLSIQEPAIQQAIEKGVEVIGDIELFARHASAPVVAITGANGKSTVTTLLAEMASEAGLAVRAGGNLGTPALDLLTAEEPDLYVLELSSFQLETTHSLEPQAAVVLNISPDHMDRYTDLEHYALSKQKIYNGQGVMVINHDDPMVSAMREPQREILEFSLEPHASAFCVRLSDGQKYLAEGENTLMPVSAMAMQGSHNHANALAALALGRAIGIAMPAMLAVLRRFTGLPHRCERVITTDGVLWFNDSKGTNVGASCAAIEGLAEVGKIILIAGGVGKGADFSAFGESMKGRVCSVLIFGQDGRAIADAIPDGIQTVLVADLNAAVKLAAEQASVGNVVLFSPACASFDMFRDYVARGEAFIHLVHQVTNQ